MLRSKKIIGRIILMVFAFNVLTQLPLTTQLGLLSSLAPQTVKAATVTVTSSADSGTGTLREALANVQDGDVITFDNNVSTITLSTGVLKVPVDKSITIRGRVNGGTPAVTIDANGSSQILQINPPTEVSSVNVTVENLIFLNGNANYLLGSTKPGGAIYAGSTSSNRSILIANNCVFENNKSMEQGGAIFSGSSITLTDCSFINNKTEGSAAFGAGGAVLATNTNDGNSTIVRCNFIGNEGSASGGAVAINKNSTVNIYNSSFIGNRLREGGTNVGGSAVSNSSTGTRIIAANSTFYGNVSPNNSSGTIYSGTTTSPGVVLAYCTIANNAIDNTAALFLNASGTASVYNSIIVGNGDGTPGKQFNKTSFADVASTVIMPTAATPISFEDVFGFDPSDDEDPNYIDIEVVKANGYIMPSYEFNSVGVGSIYTSKPNSNFPDSFLSEINAYDQIGNPRPALGRITYGAVQQEVRPKKVTDATDNVGSPVPGSLRDVIANANEYDTIVFDDEVTEITLESEIEIDKPLIIGVTDMDKVKIKGDGSERIFNFTAAAGNYLVLRNLSLEDGDAKTGNGGALLVDKGFVLAEGCDFKNNTATNGGAVYAGRADITSASSFTARDCTFESNEATNGGAIYTVGKDAVVRYDIVLERCFLTDNTVDTGKGSALYIERGASVVAANSTFYSNKNKNNGDSVVYAARDTATASTTMLFFYYCTIVNNDKGIFNELSGRTHMYNCIIVGNGDKTAIGQVAAWGSNNTTSSAVNPTGMNIIEGANNNNGNYNNTYEGVFGASPVVENGCIIPLAGGPAYTQGALSLRAGNVNIPVTTGTTGIATGSAVVPQPSGTVALNPFMDSISMSRDQRGNPRPLDGYSSFGSVFNPFTNTTRTVTSNLDDAGSGTLRNVIAAAMPGDTINFADDVTNIGLTTAIEFSKVLTIEGNVDVSGAPATKIYRNTTASIRIFNLNVLEVLTRSMPNMATVVINNLELKDAAQTSTSNGGAINANNPIEINNCIFTNNATLSASGGAVYAASSIKATNCSFIGNKAIRGGGIMGKNNVLIVNCAFVGNEAAAGNYSETSTTIGYGGSAISTDAQPIVAVNSTFSSNKNTNTHGVLHTSLNSATRISLYHCTVVNNIVEEAGTGAFLTAGPQGTSAVFSTATAAAPGGFTIYNSIIAGNGDGSARAQMSSRVTNASLTTSRDVQTALGTNIIQDNTTNAFADIFGTNTLVGGRYILPKEEAVATITTGFAAGVAGTTQSAAQLKGTEANDPTGLREMVAEDQIGRIRPAKNITFGTVELAPVSNPVIIYSSPEDEEKGVALNIGKIEIGFSQAMEGDTLIPANVILANVSKNETIEYTSYEYKEIDDEFMGYGYTITLPEDVLEEYTEYRVTVTDAVKDINGLSLVSGENEITFRTIHMGEAFRLVSTEFYLDYNPVGESNNSITDSGLVSGDVTGVVTFVNLESEGEGNENDENVTVVMALYKKSGEEIGLADILVDADITVPAGGVETSVPLTFEGVNNAQGDYLIKVFAFRSLESIKPIFDCSIFDNRGLNVDM